MEEKGKGKEKEGEREGGREGQEEWDGREREQTLSLPTFITRRLL